MVTQVQNAPRTSAPYSGTPATKMNSAISGQLVLRSLAVHELPNGTIAAVNGNAATELSDGNVETINCSQGYQSIPAADLKQAIERRQGSYKITLDCGPLWGLQSGRAIHLDPADALAFGVDQTFVRHTVTARAEEPGKQLDGVIFLSSSAMIASGANLSGMESDSKLQYTDGTEKVFDTYPLADGLARAKNLADKECDMPVTDKFGAQLVIRKFPKGNQRQVQAEQRASNNQYTHIRVGRPAAVTPAEPMPSGRPANPYLNF